MILPKIAAIIEDGGHGVSGQSLFIFHMLETVKSGVLLFEDIEGTVRDPNLPGYFTSFIRVNLRDTDYVRLLARGMELCEYLDQKNIDTPEFKINHIHPSTLPVAYPIPESDYMESAFTLIVNWVQK